MPTFAPQAPPHYYQLAIALAKPLYRYMLRRRASKADAKRADVSIATEIAMRFATDLPFATEVRKAAAKPCVWVHAVSLGETNTAAPIVEMLLKQGFEVLITNTTQTGFARTKKLFAGRVQHSFVVVDSPAEIMRFLARYQPACALFVETELWPNILYKLMQQRIPSVLINARLNNISFKRYAKFARLTRSMLHNITAIICQDTQSVSYFKDLGAEPDKLLRAPSLKFAACIPDDIHSKAAALRRQWQLRPPYGQDAAHQSTVNQDAIYQNSVRQASSKIMVAASTHEGEEDCMLASFSQILAAHSDARLILVPRHPERFDTVAEHITKAGFKLYRRSKGDVMTHKTQVYLADSMGELLLWYSVADFAFVGGSLVEHVGGHNPIEACLLSAAVIMGRHTQKCQVVVDALDEACGIRLVADEAELCAQWLYWLDHPDAAAAQAKRALQLAQKRGDADVQQFDKIQRFLPV